MKKFSKYLDKNLTESVDNKTDETLNSLEQKVKSLIDTHLKIDTYGGYDDLVLTNLTGKDNLTASLINLFSDKEIQKILKDLD